MGRSCVVSLLSFIVSRVGHTMRRPCQSQGLGVSRSLRLLSHSEVFFLGVAFGGVGAGAGSTATGDVSATAAGAGVASVVRTSSVFFRRCREREERVVFAIGLAFAATATGSSVGSGCAATAVSTIRSRGGVSWKVVLAGV